MPGMFSGKRLSDKRREARWKKVNYRNKILQTKKKKDPLEGSPQARGIVLEKRTVEQKQPSSGLIKAVRVQLIKNGKQITAFVPGDNAIKHIDEHDTVIIEGLHGSQGGAVGSMSGVKWKVSKVNGIDLYQLRKGKKQKGGR